MPQEAPSSKGVTLGHPCDTTAAVVQSTVMRGHIVTSEVQTELGVRVVLPNGKFNTLRILVDFACQAVNLANPNVFGVQISEKYESPNGGTYPKLTGRRLCRGGDEQIDVKLNLWRMWMVVFHLLVWPNMACPNTLSGIYLAIWFSGTQGVMNIV